MKVAIALILLTLACCKANAQEDFLQWTKNVKIAWPDFKGKVDVKSPFAAISAVGIYYKYNYSGAGKVYKIRFTTYATFDRKKSWSKRSSRTATILNHEQLHFDLAELVARAFKKQAEQTIYSKNYKKEIGSIFNRYTHYLQRLQEKYDVQTMHSNNTAKQKEWEKLIRQGLQR